MEIPGVESYNEKVSTPQAVCGYRIGDRHTRPDEVLTFFRAIASSSDRVVLGTHGQSYEGRPLIHAIVSSPANLVRLEDIRKRNLQISTDPGTWDKTTTSQMPLIVWMGYGVHGNESSGVEAAMLLLYHLAAGQGSAVDSILENCVVLILPSLNPDGHSRFTSWVNGYRGAVANTDAQDREHWESWPGSRGNHYWFDLNRDWMPLEHPESRGRLELYYSWRPQLVTDYHEMGPNGTYFFQPGIANSVHPFIPKEVQEMTSEIGQYHAKALDRIGSLYYHGENFDDFYIGKGSTYTDMTGAIGILFEQAGTKALSRETSRGVMDYAFTIRNHLVTSLSSLQAAYTLREKMLQQQHQFYREAGTFAKKLAVKGYIINAGGDSSRAWKLAELLRRHQIRLFELARPISVADKSFLPGSAYVVPGNQSQTRLLHAMMERRTDFTFEKFYDISTWTMPLAYGVSYLEWTQPVEGILGKEIQEVRKPSQDTDVRESRYGYLMPWNEYFSFRALHRMQQAGLRVFASFRPFEIQTGDGKKRFDRGTIFIPTNGQQVSAEVVKESLHLALDQDSVEIFGISGGTVTDGSDLGSDHFRVLEKPRAALVSGRGTNANEVGEIWHLLGEKMGMPVALIDLDSFHRIDLDRYNTIVLVGGSYGKAEQPFAVRLKHWMESGGLLIALRGAAHWIVEQELVAESAVKKEDKKAGRNTPYADADQAANEEVVGGAIFQVELDKTHPFSYGLESPLAVFRDHTFLLEPSKTPGANAARYSSHPLWSGYTPEGWNQKLAHSAAVIAQHVSRGYVVLFADNPTFRSYWYGSSRLFLNAIAFGRVF